MSEKRCQRCKHFNGFDGVGELWTLCSLGDFMGTKIDCGSFERKVSKVDLLKKIREQQATIKRLEEENKELEKNFDDLVKWSSEISKRNVLLDEKIGRLQEEEKLYAQEILRLNTLLKQYQANQDLGGGY